MGDTAVSYGTVGGAAVFDPGSLVVCGRPSGKLHSPQVVDVLKFFRYELMVFLAAVYGPGHCMLIHGVVGRSPVGNSSSSRGGGAIRALRQRASLSSWGFPEFTGTLNNTVD